MLSSCPRALRLSLLAALLCSAASLFAQDHATADAFVANPAASIQVDAAKSFRETKTILVPTVILRVATEGSVFVAKGAGSSTASAKGSYAVHGLDKAALMALAAELQENFVKKLRADGWTVLTYEDVKADPEIVKLERRAADGALGLPAEKDNGSRASYALVSPTEAQSFKPAMQGVHWPFRFIAKARNATVVIPQIDIIAPQVWGETRKGYKSASAEVKHLPGMNLNFAMILVLTPKGGGGVVCKLKHAIVNTGENVGTFVDAKDTSPGAANGISKGLSILGGGGSINRASAAYQFAIEPKAFNSAVLRGGDAFLGQVAKVMSAEMPK